MKKYRAICYRCKKECEIHFKPTDRKQVFCLDCVKENKILELEEKVNKRNNEAINIQAKAIEKGILGAISSIIGYVFLVYFLFWILGLIYDFDYSSHFDGIVENFKVYYVLWTFFIVLIIVRASRMFNRKKSN